MDLIETEPDDIAVLGLHDGARGDELCGHYRAVGTAAAAAPGDRVEKTDEPIMSKGTSRPGHYSGAREQGERVRHRSEAVHHSFLPSRR